MSGMSGNHLTVLVVEDNLGDARLIQRSLEDASGSFVVEHADRIARAIDRLANGGIDIVLLDLSLPDSSGLQTFALIRSCAEDVPIVVLTGLDDEEAATAAVQAGAQDYLVKGTFDSEVIARSVRYAVERHRMQEDLRRLATVDDLTGSDEDGLREPYRAGHEAQHPVHPVGEVDIREPGRPEHRGRPRRLPAVGV